MIRDYFNPPPTPEEAEAARVKRLGELTQGAIAQGRTQQAVDALDRIVNPPLTDAERGRRNLGKF